LTFESGVNFTAGIPFIRTSPDHGTAYNITGQNKASTDSFREAIFTAIDIVNNRRDFKEMTSNPLNPVNIEEFLGSEEDSASILPEDSFDNFIPITASKYSKALLREKEDKEVELLNDKKIIEEEEEEFDDDVYEEEEYVKKEDLTEDGDGESL
jgi:hypothetical protein